VVVNYRRSEAAARELSASLGPGALAVHADVSDRDQVKAMLAQAERVYGEPVTTVVNNALDYSFNGDARARVQDIAWADLEAQFAVAVKGALHVIQTAAPGMERRGFGRVINIGTNLFQNPVVPYHDYVAAKGALLALTRTAAADLGPSASP
jgi:3-oxoacyl-[acyl-carrier protein] reductase